MSVKLLVNSKCVSLEMLIILLVDMSAKENSDYFEDERSLHAQPEPTICAASGVEGSERVHHGSTPS